MTKKLIPLEVMDIRLKANELIDTADVNTCMNLGNKIIIKSKYMYDCLKDGDEYEITVRQHMLQDEKLRVLYTHKPVTMILDKIEFSTPDEYGTPKDVAYVFRKQTTVNVSENIDFKTIEETKKCVLKNIPNVIEKSLTASIRNISSSTK